MKIKYTCKIREPGQFFVGDLVIPNNRFTEQIFGEKPRSILGIYENEGNQIRIKLSGIDFEPTVSVFELFKPKL